MNKDSCPYIQLDTANFGRNTYDIPTGSFHGLDNMFAALYNGSLKVTKCAL